MTPQRTKRTLKTLGIPVAVMLIATVVTMGALFIYYANMQNSNQVGELFTITENSQGSWVGPTEMGDYLLFFNTTDMVGGDEEFYSFNITLSADANGNRSINFNISEDLTNGVNVTILNGATEVTDNEVLVWNPGETKTFTYTVSLDEYTPADTYSTSLLLTKA